MSVCCQSEDAVHFPGAAELVELYLDNVLVEIRYFHYIYELLLIFELQYYFMYT